MFTVKVREERTIPATNDTPQHRDLIEIIYEAKRVMLMQGNIVIDLQEPDSFGAEQLTYSPVTGDAAEHYSGRIYVMNRYGATVATYNL